MHSPFQYSLMCHSLSPKLLKIFFEDALTSLLAHNSNEPCVFRISVVYSEVRVLVKGAQFWHTATFSPIVISGHIMSFSGAVFRQPAFYDFDASPYAYFCIASQ